MSLALVPDPPPPPALEDLQWLLLVQLERLENLAPRIASGEPDELRRFRVAARRTRALLRAGRPLVDPTWSDPLRAELAWLGGSLGPARDLDVLVAHVRAVSAGFDPGERFALARVIRVLEEERLAARADAVAALESRRAAALLTELRRELPAIRTRPCDLTPLALAAAEFRRLRKAVRSLDGVATDDELHRLRIRVKRARYSAEFAERSAGRVADRVVERARTVQDILGEHQDASVAETRVRALLGRPHGLRWAVAAGRLIERQAVRREQARVEFPPAWGRLDEAGRALANSLK